MAKLVIAPSAEDDLKRIVDYIALDLCNPEAAESFLDELDAVYDSLESMPGSFPYCKDGYLRANEYHQAGIKDYLMIFRIDDGGDTVRILHFNHGSQDYLVKVLSEM